ncbi:MAG: DNA-processing protein DprA [Candidatus Saccharimonadales bacterium]
MNKAVADMNGTVMKWLAIIGTREATSEMRRDVSERVRRAVGDGCGIVTGGSTGVDTVAMMAAMHYGGVLRVYLPIALADYEKSLRERAEQGKCLPDDAEQTIATLKQLKTRDHSALVEPDDFTELTPEAFYARNEQILQLADAVVAYHLKGNATASKLPAGTLLTAERACEIGKVVEVFEYAY